MMSLVSCVFNYAKTVIQFVCITAAKHTTLSGVRLSIDLLTMFKFIFMIALSTSRAKIRRDWIGCSHLPASVTVF